MALVHIILTYLPMKSGMCKYKQEGHAAVTNELLQLHTKDSFGPLRAEDMTEDQNKDALEMLMFLKKKHNGKIKARGCADRRKQREKYNNVYATSPTVSTEAVIISTVIDAY